MVKEDDAAAGNLTGLKILTSNINFHVDRYNFGHIFYESRITFLSTTNFQV